MLVQEATSQIGSNSRALDSGAERPTVVKERVESTPEKTSRAQENNAQNQSGQGSSSRARLNFDPEKHRVFVEIVDPESGDVITRFPPEQIADHIDEVLEQNDQGTNLEEAGLIYDQKA